MHPDAVAALRCPVDRAALELVGRTLRCTAGHAFDLARQGYVNLHVGRDPGTADDPAMISAREQVLAGGRFAAVTDALVRRVTAVAPAGGVVVDLGAGTGHHLAAVLDVQPDRVGVAIDLSKAAARRAARAHDRLAAVVADVWQPLPVADAAAAVVTCVFAPRNAPEIARVLRADGALVVVTPGSDHLAELVDALGLLTVDGRKAARLRAAVAGHLEPDGDVERLQVRWDLSRDDVRAVVAMGPSADHLDHQELSARTAQLPEVVHVTGSFELRTLRPAGRSAAPGS